MRMVMALTLVGVFVFFGLLSIGLFLFQTGAVG